MNHQLSEFARKTLLEQLLQLPEEWQRKFKLMYGRNNGKRPVDETEKMRILDVITELPDDKLDWAMQQVENSLKKLQVQH